MAFAHGRLGKPWAIALAVAVPLAVAYLILAPPAGDLAAATYRSDLFARVGFTAWDTGWYAAHGYWLPGYSLLSPALGALLGVRMLLALSAVAASTLFALIAERVFGTTAARLAAAWFALGFCVGMLSGRVPYDLGFALGLGSILALILADRGSRRSPIGTLPAALVLAVLTSIASPVAGAFLGLAGLAYIATDRRHGLALCATALIPILVLGIAYPDGGYEPFAASAFWPALAGVLLIALLLPQGPLTPRGRLMLRVGAAMYALALIGAYAIHTPVGGNAARLGPLLARTATRRRAVGEAARDAAGAHPRAALLAAGDPDPRLQLDRGRPLGARLLLQAPALRAAPTAPRQADDRGGADDRGPLGIGIPTWPRRHRAGARLGAPARHPLRGDLLPQDAQCLRLPRVAY